MATLDPKRLSEQSRQMLPSLIAAAAGGTAYLAAQSMFANLRGETVGAPFERIAAILLGPGEAPPQDELTFTAAGMAVLIHFALALVYARVLNRLVRGESVGLAALVGAVFGVVIVYLSNFYLIAPSAFPWFTEVRNAATLLDHALFGAVTAVVIVVAREWLASEADAAALASRD